MYKKHRYGLTPTCVATQNVRKSYEKFMSRDGGYRPKSYELEFFNMYNAMYYQFLRAKLNNEIAMWLSSRGYPVGEGTVRAVGNASGVLQWVSNRMLNATREMYPLDGKYIPNFRELIAALPLYTHEIPGYKYVELAMRSFEIEPDKLKVLFDEEENEYRENYNKVVTELGKTHYMSRIVDLLADAHMGRITDKEIPEHLNKTEVNL